MICILGKDDFSFSNTAVTIGKFDALHVGHKALIGKLASYKQKGLKTLVLRLDIPSEEKPVRTELDRIEILENMDVDVYIRLPFTEKLAGMSAESFISDFLIGRLGAKAIVVGEDFRFGRGRQGNTETLIGAGKKFGFETVTVEKVCINGQKVSSSAVRKLLKDGEINLAEKLLGN
ncbi:MAG: hypothetical protein K6E85_03750 [Lachnospiraceae bacterium]|nr:hypothetical protein [Lachnospiraceae bacterium]